MPALLPSDATSLWQESLLSQPQSRTGSTSLTASPPHSSTSNVLYAYTLQRTGGAVRSAALPDQGLAWQVENGSAGSLQLLPFSSGCYPPHSTNTPITIDFPTQIFPGVACVDNSAAAGSSFWVVGITATGQAYIVDLRAATLQQQAGSQSDTGHPAINYADLTSYLPSLGAPSCISTADGHVMVGGAHGPLLCLPLAWLQHPTVEAGPQPFELRESGWGIKSFIAGVLQRQHSPSAVSVMPLMPSFSSSVGRAGTGVAAGMVVVTYDDCTLRGFNLSKRAQLFTEALEHNTAAAARAVPVFSVLHMDPSGPSSTPDAQATGTLVVQLECRDALHRSLAAYSLVATAGGSRLALRHRTDLAAPAATSAISAAVCGSVIWVLLKVPRDGARLVGFDRAHGRLCATAALAEAAMLPHKLVKNPEGGDAMMMALWESSLAASISAAAPPDAETERGLESDSSRSVSSSDMAAVAAHQVLARLLSAGGGLCRLSLRDALAYHGAQMTLVEAESVPLKRLSTYVYATVHALQRRSPNVPPARCWLTLLSSYQEAWGRRHAPLSLLPPAYPPASQHTPTPISPLCLLRGSGMLAAIRGTAPVEALAMDASELAISGLEAGGHTSRASTHSASDKAAALVTETVLPPSLLPVHRASRGLGRLLGPLTLDVFVSSLTPTPTPSTHTPPGLSAAPPSSGTATPARGGPGSATLFQTAGGGDAGVNTGLSGGALFSTATGSASAHGIQGLSSPAAGFSLGGIQGAPSQRVHGTPCIFEGGADAAAALAPTFATMVIEGPNLAAGKGAHMQGGVGVGVGVDDVAREQRVAWRQRRQRALLAVGQELGSLGDLVGSIRQYVTYLAPSASQTQSCSPATTELCPVYQSPAAATLITSAARQLARAQMSAARDVLVLLGVLTQLGAVGGTPLTAQQLADLQGSVYGEVAVLLQQATLVFWLCSTHATAVPASAIGQPSSLEPALAFLRLGDREGPRRQPLPGFGMEGNDESLAVRLLSSLAPQLPPASHALQHTLSAVRALVAALQHGLPLPATASAGLAGTHTGPAAGVSCSTPLPVRVLQLGYQLFLANEHAPLMGLTRLAQAATASLPCSQPQAAGLGTATAAHQAQGPEFLRGLSLACRLGGVSGAERQQRVSEAAGCFFRAAASLDPAGRGAQALVHATVLRSLRQLLTGYPEQGDDLQSPSAFTQEAPGAQQQQQQCQPQRAFALLQVQLYEVVMMLFEREGAPEGAVIFARAALQHLPAAYDHKPPSHMDRPSSSAPHMASNPGRGYSASGEGIMATDGKSTFSPEGEIDVVRQRRQQLRVREARLWSNIYKYCSELRQWEDAYAALVCNPDPQRALECLRQLIKELSEQGQVLTLCSLPLAGAVCMQAEEVEHDEHGQQQQQQRRGAPNPPATPPTTAPTPAAGVAPDGSSVEAGGANSVGSKPEGVVKKRGRLEGGLGWLADEQALPAPVVSLLEEAVKALQRRALNMDLGTKPQPYRLLYDFLVARSDMRGAARAMVAYSRRLRAEGAPGLVTVAEALTAYELALNALALVNDSISWLNVHADPWLAAHPLPGAPAPPFPLTGIDTYVGADGPAGTSVSVVSARVKGLAITHQTLSLEYELMKAAAVLSATGSSPGSDPLQAQRSPHDVLSQLLGARAYDAAHRLTLCAWPKSSAQRTSALESIAAAMAKAAARAQLQGDTAAGDPFADMLSLTPGAGPSLQPTLLPPPLVVCPQADPGQAEGLLGQGLMGSRAAPAWAKLRTLLMAYASQQGLGSALRRSAAAAILREDSRMQLPPWLLEMFQGGEEAREQSAGVYEGMASKSCGPAELMDLYMAADRLEDAVAVVEEHVDRWSNTDPRLRRGRLAAAWFPHRRIQALRQQLRVMGADTSRIDLALSRHEEVLEHDAPLVQLPSPASTPSTSPLGLFGTSFEPMSVQ